MSLLRTPWVNIEDKLIVKFAKTENVLSYWNSIKPNPEFSKLNDLLLNSKKMGIFQAIKNFCIESNFFDYHIGLDKSGRAESNIWKIPIDVI